MQEKNSFVLKGNICYSGGSKKLVICPKSYVVCQEGICKGVYQELPKEYESYIVKDMGDALITPGLVDLHTHAPQYAFRGLGMDLELLDWLNTHTFPEEMKYADADYAKKAYTMFVEDLKKSAVTRAVIFATLHIEGTKILMDLLEASGLDTYVGKVSMDRNALEGLQEENAEAAAKAVRQWLLETEGRYEHTKPILTPRFIPSCSDALMAELKSIQEETGLPLQSHLSENPGEIQWVQELCPNSSNYSDAYYQAGLFGGACPTIMAHCVWLKEEEISLIKKQGVFIAHCPQSNTNLSSGIAPVRQFLDEGLFVGLGSDVAGGYSTSVLRAMADTIQCSKLRWRLVDAKQKPVTLEEAFYMGTAGGGAFFGKVGSFLEGYEFDAVVFDDSELLHPQELSVRERLERLIYLADDRQIKSKFVKGNLIYEKNEKNS